MFMGLIAAAIMKREPDMDSQTMPAVLKQWVGDTPQSRTHS